MNFDRKLKHDLTNATDRAAAMKSGVRSQGG